MMLTRKKVLFVGGPGNISTYECEERMRKKRLGKTNLMVTPVGMGGIPIMRLRKKERGKPYRGKI